MRNISALPASDIVSASGDEDFPPGVTRKSLKRYLRNPRHEPALA